MVELICNDLMMCVNKIYNPGCSTQERSTCYLTITEFKETHDSCMQCGIYLAAQDQNPVARHFGLQLIEHVVKHRWNSMGEDARLDYQQSLLKFLQGVMEKDERYVMEALARLTVETAKRMWPQMWTSFMKDMSSLCNAGLVHVEMVLIIFRRLAEDIHEFQSGLDQQRKKEMTYALNENVRDILDFLLQNLELPKTDDVCLQTHLRSVTLSTLASFVEWVEFPVLLRDDCKLLLILYSLLGYEQLKVSTCECLLGILSRKGDVKRTAEHRERLLILLSKDALDGFWTSSVKASQLLPQEGGGVVEVQYVFLKRICQVLVHLGISQLAPLWLNKKEGFLVPEHFSFYLEVVLEFTKHDSQLLSMTSCDVWLSFMNHNHIKDCTSFKDFLPKVLTICRQRLLKLGDPTLSNHITSEFSRIDFDGIEEFSKFFITYRSKVMRIIGHLAQLMPRTVAQEASRVAEDLVARTTAADYSSHSMEYLEWCAFVMYLECWTNTFKSDPLLMEVDSIKEQGLCVLKQLVSFTTSASLIMQCQFRCLQTNLLCFLHFDTALFESYMQKIFSSVGFLGGGTDKYNLPKDVVATRRLIVLCFIHLCEAYPHLLVTQVDYFTSIYHSLLQRDELVNAEKANFMEALLILRILKHLANQTAANQRVEMNDGPLLF